MGIVGNRSRKRWVEILGFYDLGLVFHPIVSLVTYEIHVFDDPTNQCDSGQSQ
jgi:hypothetical protein